MKTVSTKIMERGYEIPSIKTLTLDSAARICEGSIDGDAAVAGESIGDSGTVITW